jgi:hypothetical protein
MPDAASIQDYPIEYIRAHFELLEDEDEGVAYWLERVLKASQKPGFSEKTWFPWPGQDGLNLL